MNSIVIYGSRTGNTRKVASAIADVLAHRGDVLLVAAEDATAIDPQADELLVVGSPTESHTMTPAVREWLEAMGPNGLSGVTATAFDTRLGMPRWPSGTAATAIKRRLVQLGANLVEPEGRFIVAGRPAVLVSGELGRARAWAAELADVAEPAIAAKAAVGCAS
ncbi:MAG TPA: flavodoxin domain-containing protein [Candidatus Dormibacteraeota bacterium]|nr:flavodoxin domain-containing protein [Candidatus Dormibacteraeota bacterium]